MTVLTKPVVLLALNLVWLGAIAALWWGSLPRLPLDSANDPETLASLDRAMAAHPLRYAVAGLVVPLASLMVYWLSRGRQYRE